MARLIEMGEAQAATGQSYRRASAGLAERDMCSANADGCRDTAFTEVQTRCGAIAPTPTRSSLPRACA